MKLFVDAQMPEALAAALIAWGFDAAHVRDILPPDCDDNTIWQYATPLTGSIVITRDADFVDLAARGVGQPRVIWVRVGNCSNARLIALFEERIDALMADLNRGSQLVELR